MDACQTFDTDFFDRAGLNRQAVFNLHELPEDIASDVRENCTSTDRADSYRQLILLGHAGRRLWESVKSSDVDREHPIDDFTVRTVERWFAECQPRHAYEILYPSPHVSHNTQTRRPIGLQRLGQLAGWHHATPFMVGIDAQWGTWFAYRAVIVADTSFAPRTEPCKPHPCDACGEKTCIAACPADALRDGQFDLKKCVGYRKQADSLCRDTCVARISCPVGSEHRYSDDQIRHSYSLSLRAIEKYF